jgi:HEPN domain-containing protein
MTISAFEAIQFMVFFDRLQQGKYHAAAAEAQQAVQRFVKFRLYMLSIRATYAGT